MSAIEDFLKARLDDDERIAKAANPAPWRRITDKQPRLDPNTIFGASYPGDQEKLRNVCGLDYSWERDANAEHITRHDPKRALDEVAAKRKLIEDVAGEATGLDMSVDLDRRCGGRDETEEPYLGNVLLRVLAAVYRDHPDYRKEWAA